MALRIRPYVVLNSSDRGLEKGFDWAKRQALDWVSLDCPVGDYYEAALPNRSAFCMRDVSHQCTGAEVLGLSALNLNMLGKFAEAIDERLDYCSYWEIDRWNRPCPVDYESERDFWYNLPANFDVLDACYRMYLWTGNREYIEGDKFDRFFQLTMTEYIRRWDRDNDGLPDRGEGEGRRGLASYDESPFASMSYKVGGDLLGAMVRGHRSFAKISQILDRREYAAIYGKLADELQKKLDGWYDADSGNYAQAMLKDGQLFFSQDHFSGGYLLYWDLIPDVARAQRVSLEYSKHVPSMQVEGFSHAPELLWRYGHCEEALSAWRHLTSPEMPRREYPEASYAAVGAAATGLMGIEPDAWGQRIRTMPALCGISWVELEHVPALGRLISVRHDGDGQTTCSIDDGASVTWRAMFAGERELAVGEDESGQRITQHDSCPYSGKPVSYVEVELQPGKPVTVRIVG